MKTKTKKCTSRALPVLLMVGLMPVAGIADDTTALEKRIADLEKRMEQGDKSASEWKHPHSLVHMAGYADVGYTDTETGDGSFRMGGFSPIFHYQYRDLVMLESELEIGLTDGGETTVDLEYLSADLFLNDYMTLVAGKFLSPIGQFRQNLHPSWINKLPSAPIGFGHDGAAPTSDVGLQLRGGLLLGSLRSNYAVYVGNGPELNTTWNGTEYELEGVRAEGMGADRDGKKVFGGRFGVIPMTGVEVGVSYLGGKTAVTNIVDPSGTAPDPEGEILGQGSRSYTVTGADFAWQTRWGVRLRGEFVQSEVGADTGGSATASPGGKWTAWYLQGSSMLFRTKFEGVLRYGEFDAPGNEADRNQVAVGLNYRFAGNVVAKAAYEFNDNPNDPAPVDDRLLLQLAYGF